MVVINSVEIKTVHLPPFEANEENYRNLERVAFAIFGKEWVSPTARVLGVEVKTIQRYKAKKRKTPNLHDKLVQMAKSACDVGFIDSLRQRATLLEEYARQSPNPKI